MKIDDFEINPNYKDEKYMEYTNTKEYSEAYQKYLKLSEEEKRELKIIPDKYDVDINSIYSATAVETNVALIHKDYIDLSEVHQAGLIDGYGGNFVDSDHFYYKDKIGPVYESEWSMEKLLNEERDETEEIIYQYLVD